MDRVHAANPAEKAIESGEDAGQLVRVPQAGEPFPFRRDWSGEGASPDISDDSNIALCGQKVRKPVAEWVT